MQGPTVAHIHPLAPFGRASHDYCPCSFENSPLLLFEDATVQRCREASANTILMMMNGIGPVGTLDGLDSFLKRLPEMLKPGGQVLVDSGDVRQRQVVTGTGGLDWPARTGDYVGEAWIRLEYLGQVGEPFRELYVDFDTLKERSNRQGWDCERVFGETESYVARLTRT